MSSARAPSFVFIVVVVLALGAIAVRVMRNYSKARDAPGASEEEDELPKVEEEPPEKTQDSPTAPEEPPEAPEEPIEPPEEMEAPCAVVVEGLTLDRGMVYAGEAVSITVVVTNTGGRECSYGFELWVGEGVVSSEELVLGPYESVEVVQEVSRSEFREYPVRAGNFSASFMVIEASLDISNIEIHPISFEPGDPVRFSVQADNQHRVNVTEEVVFEFGGMDPLGRSVTLGPDEIRRVEVETTFHEPGNFTVSVGGLVGFFEVRAPVEEWEPEEEPEPERPEPWVWYEPDPATDGFTSLLPPGASPVRLSLPASLEDIFFRWDAGVGAYGLHGGGHIEGLDHVWIEIRAGGPVRSWANGTVSEIRWSGTEEEGEWHIFIDYGRNLTGSHMEVETCLVEVGDYVERGDPVGYGMGFFEGAQSAEFGLKDRGRSDGIWAGGGVAVSPYDYLVEEEKLALVEAYKAHTVEKYGKDPRITWLFDAATPYLTNPLLIHIGNEGRLTGEWYLVSEDWGPGWPHDLLTFIEADNPWFSGGRVYSNDDWGEDSQARNIEGTFDVDYERGRVLIRNEKWGGILFGIFEIDESGDRAILRIEYDEYRYPREFSEEAILYIERTNLGRRGDAMELGVRDHL